MKTIPKSIFLLLMLISSGMMMGCNEADQFRLFPLGSCSSGFVFVEVQLYRTTDPEGNRFEMPSKWYGESFFMIYDETQKLVSSLQLDSLRLKEKISGLEFMKNSFEKGLKLAKQLPGYKAALPFYVSYCDFQQTCQEAALRHDTLTHQLFVKLTNGNEHEVRILRDTSSIAKRFLEYYGRFNGGFISYGSIDISSVRKYQLGVKTLTLVHLAHGDKPENMREDMEEEEIPKRKEYKPKIAFNKLGNSVIYEPLLHHGHGFDFFMVE